MSADPGSLLSRYRRLIHLRNSELALRRGGYRAGSSSNSSVYAFGRDLRNEAIFVIHNFSDFPAANFTVSMNQSNLAMGTYYLVNAETGASLGEVSVNYQGGFTDLQLATELGGKESLILKIQNTPAGVSDENTIPGTFTLYPNYRIRSTRLLRFHSRCLPAHRLRLQCIICTASVFRCCTAG